jgi:DNA polymerase-3 subunit gamma/tau
MSVFHLKYRPQKIEELDLPEVSDQLKKLLQAEEIPHTWLFAGPKGSGKTSAARILARAVNCLKPKGVEPCNECANCKEILKGNSLDILEIDAASNRGIDDVRSLKEGAYLSPSRLKKKVIIIDEVHMLTREAFNALLKLLEEPPKDLFFILCTTDEGKIPDTVMSRLSRVNFTKGKEANLMSSLKKIIEGEKIKIEPATVKLIISRSDGSFRNLQRTFNEIYLQVGNKMELAAVTAFLEKGGEYKGEEIESELGAGKGKEILEKLEKLAEMGADFGILRERWIDYFQTKLLSFYGVGEKNENGLDMVAVSEWLSLLIEAGNKEKLTELSQLPLQLAVVEFLNKKPNIKYQKEEIGVVEKKVADKTIEVKPKPKKSSGNKVSVEEIEKKWSEVLAAVKPYNHSVEAFLRAARPGKIRDGVLILEVFYKFHKERLEEAKNRKIVNTGLATVLGEEFEFECVLAEGGKRIPLVFSQNQSLKEDKGEISDIAEKIFS